jgi:hypothetical protein
MISTWRSWPKWWRRSLTVSFLMLAGFGLLLWRCSGPDYHQRVDHPMNLAEAKRLRIFAHFPFPASAHNIYFAGYADWIAHETLIRFDAAEPECEAAIPEILDWYEKERNRNWTYSTVPITSEASLPGPIDTKWLPDVDWWSGLTVKHGFYAGRDSSNMPQV